MVPPFFLLRPVDELHPQQRGAYVETLLASRRYMQRISGRTHGLTDSKGQTELRRPALPSRNNFPAPCIALFHRARAKVVVIEGLPLAQHVDWPAFVA